MDNFEKLAKANSTLAKANKIIRASVSLYHKIGLESIQFTRYS